MAVCGLSIGREISFVRNNLKWFHSCLTHMHSKNICLIVSSYEWQSEHRGVFILPKVKSILFRYNMLWSIFYWKLRLKLFIVTTLIYRFSSNRSFHLEKLCRNIFGRLVYYLMIVSTLNIFLSQWVSLTALSWFPWKQTSSCAKKENLRMSPDSLERLFRW